ncbi:MAG: 16S rRNA methyltransferase [Chlamydiae bacterium]|nr:16S rRNA methyltransferase [Chlamydiota bacterium]
MLKKIRLVLLPNVLNPDQESIASCFTAATLELVPTLDGLIVENEKEGRKYLKRFSFPEGRTFRDVPMRELSEHTSDEQMKDIIAEMKPGQVWGLISDAGMPCFADPGAKIVYLARRAGIEVEAHVGPSSILFAVMLSGLYAQKFTFEGYLPKEELQQIAYIKQMQLRSSKEGSTHVFIETPYRNQSLFDQLLSILEDRTQLSILSDMSLPTQEVATYTVKEWKKMNKADLKKRLVVFVIRA